MKYSGFIALMLLSSLAFSNNLGPVVAKVAGTGVYDDGAIYVFFDRPISSCSSNRRLDLEVNHPAGQQILSLAMAAFVSGRSVMIHPGSCSGSSPEFGAIGDSFFYLTSQEPS